MKQITGKIMIISEYFFKIFQIRRAELHKERIRGVKLSRFRKIAPAVLLQYARFRKFCFKQHWHMPGKALLNRMHSELSTAV